MPGESRSLPGRPSLRYLKLEAKRRLAAGEFSALHDAQAAIATEHGLPSWAALKQLIDGRSGPESHALAQLRWIVARFRDAGRPGWTAPGEDEMRQHFHDSVLAAVPAAELIAQITSLAADLRTELVVVSQGPLQACVQIAGLEYVAVAEADPAHRLTALGGYPRRWPVADARLAAPLPARTSGDAPAEMTAAAEEAFAEMSLVALVLAGGGPQAPPWVVAKGWAELGRADALHPGHRFPAHCATPLVTVTAVLRLIADGRLGLDAPVNDQLRTVRLADATITVRELLSYTAGVDSPAPAELFADHVPDLTALLGPVIGCGGPRGVVRPSNGGYAVLGQLIADVTGSPYADAAARLVLKPLGMNGSSFPDRGADLGPGAVTGYDLTREGRFVPVPAMICTIPAAAGLWATAADVVRLGAGWSSLLPADLAREALTPQAAGPGPGGYRMGLGWLLDTSGGVALHAGGAPGATACLLARVRDSRVQAIMTTRLIPLDPIIERVLRSWASS